jgi:hypothetical protein
MCSRLRRGIDVGEHDLAGHSERARGSNPLSVEDIMLIRLTPKE